MFNDIRAKFEHLLSTHKTIETILNPTSESMVDTAKLLYAVEDVLSNDVHETQDTL